MKRNIAIERFGVPGIDVSHWNTFTSMKPLYDAGYRFVYIKAMEGIRPDKQLTWNIKLAVSAGMYVGFYHYYRNNVGASGKQQAEAFLALLNDEWSPELNKSIMLPPAIDVEEGNNARDPRKTTLGIAQWLRTIEPAVNRIPVVYSRQSIWSRITTSPAWMWRYIGWVAQYTGRDLTMIPSGWDPDSVMIWQWAIMRRHKWAPPAVAGVKGELDINTFLGSENLLRDFCHPHFD